MSLVFQNIDPPPPSQPGECFLPPQTRRAERGVGGSIFWKMRDIGLPSNSNILSRLRSGHLESSAFPLNKCCVL